MITIDLDNTDENADWIKTPEGQQIAREYLAELERRQGEQEEEEGDAGDVAQPGSAE